MDNIYQNNPFVVNQPQEQEQQSPFGQIDPQMMGQVAKMFGGGSGPTGGAAGFDSAGFNTAMFPSGGAAGGSTAGSGAASGGSSMSSMASSAGPWAALAAVIMANEYNAQKGGYRQEDPVKYAQDIFGGKVLEQDFQKRWLPMMFGEDLKHDKTGLGGDMAIGADLATLDFGNALEGIKDGTVGKILGGLKDLF